MPDVAVPRECLFANMPLNTNCTFMM